MAYMDLFNKKNAQLTRKIEDYFDGNSKPHLLEFMNTYRANGLKKGQQARTRNIFRPIVEKSGMLFGHRPPKLEVYDGDNVNDVASALVQTAFESAKWIEFFTNFDPMLRVLKTLYVMPQVDPISRRWVFVELNQDNCALKQNIFGDIELLLYCTGKNYDDTMRYTVWTPLEYWEIDVDGHGGEIEVPGSRQPNPYGLVPAAAFHDTTVPRHGKEWNTPTTDLIEISDIYNLHLTDSEFSAMWVKSPTLFTNAQIQGGSTETFEVRQVYGEALPRYVPTSSPGFVGGPGTVVGLESNGEPIYLDYKGPSPDLTGLDQMVKQWVMDFASDWSVQLMVEGNGAADSGFKLVVKELPNLELRKKRMKMMQGGFMRLYEIMIPMAASVGITLPDTAQLWVDFGEPNLPIDEKATEEVWSRRINEKRATRVDYFIEVKGMTKEEAEAKVAEIDAAGVPTPDRPAPSSVVATTVTI